jgi:hypothetical protein
MSGLSRRRKVQKQKADEGREDEGAEEVPPESYAPLPPCNPSYEAEQQVGDGKFQTHAV